MQLSKARDVAIDQVGDHLIKIHHAKRIADLADSPRFRKFLAGWKIVLFVGEETFELLILIGEAFPFEPPQLRFTDLSAFLRFPHVDAHGKLCLTNSAATFSPRLVNETIDFLIEEAGKLISDSIVGRNEEDFTLEFRDYWRLLPTFIHKRFWSLLRPNPPTRCVCFYTAKDFTLCAESESELKVWLKNFNCGSLPTGLRIKSTVFVWLDKPFHPKNYPKTGHDVYNIAKSSAGDIGNLLSAAIPQVPGSLPMVLGFECRTGPVLVGVELSDPKRHNITTDGKVEFTRNFGFRPHRLPSKILIQRYFGGSKVALTDVERVDANWCLHRGGGCFSSELLCKRIAIVGCGSLGADVAVMLAKSSIGSFVLIDNDLLSWGNITRHALGGSYTGYAKASSLAQHMAQQMPWLQTSYESLSLETLLFERPKIFQECDLIISTTGDWTCDCLLNAASKSFEHFPPVIFGWTEPYGIAGHALAVFQSGGCLACGMSEFGVFTSRVSEWAEGHQTLVQATGCNDFFQPYGIIDVAPIKTVIARLALDILCGRVGESTLLTWVGDIARLQALGGQVHEVWRNKLISSYSGGKNFLQSWPSNPKCPLCH